MHINTTRIYVEPGFYIVLAAAILLIPVQWVAAWIIAATVHELGHYAAVILCGHRVFSVQIGCTGAKMYTSNLLNMEWLCALAGPAVGFAMFLFIKRIPRIAACGMVQSLFNLLPIEGMDGGRALRGIMGLLVSEQLADNLQQCISIVTAVILLLGSGIFLLRFRTGVLPIVICIALLVRKVKRKFPCKDGPLQVQ